MLVQPVNGLFARIARSLGLDSVDRLASLPLFSVTTTASSAWLPCASPSLLTALHSRDREQLEAAEMDGAGPFTRFFHIVLPHLARATIAVVPVATIFLPSVFAEIRVTTNGGAGTARTNLTCLVSIQALLQFDVGAASASDLVAVVLANIVAFFASRPIGRHRERRTVARGAPHGGRSRRRVPGLPRFRTDHTAAGLGLDRRHRLDVRLHRRQAAARVARHRPEGRGAPADEVAPRRMGEPGLRVNAVALTHVRTRLTHFAIEEDPQMYRVWLDTTPMGRVGGPEGIAAVVHCLAFDAASPITAAIVRADGADTCS